MKHTKFAAAALLAVAATGVTQATAYAAPAPSASQEQSVTTTVTGSDRGVDYVLGLADAGTSVVTSVTGGVFAVDAARHMVTLRDAAGANLAELPLAGMVAGQQVRIAAEIADEGTQLTLTPQVAASASAPSSAEFIGAQQWFFAELQRASLGAAVGGVLGAAVGILFFGAGLVPGAILGALIGLAVAGGPALFDAGIAYFSGQP
ncbi:hypothetical protein [Nocardia sp. CNY236]|uniref:hypothetical protein n=1 Tax=Nocardia sp. CNY236 TaxID=1169152 RepID=UPI0003FCA6B6|nr:hypothetical protein [Nocardia sp. CNY236]